MMTNTPLAALQSWLREAQLDGFIVPRTDEYQGEYVAPCSERLAWLTGFTGSAGTAVVLTDRAWLFVDGRYTVQAAQEVAGKPIEVIHLSDHSLNHYLGEHLPKEAKLGYDPWLHSGDQVAHLIKACEKAGAHLTAVPHNPVDALWSDRPAPPLGSIVLHPLQFTGQDWRDKCGTITALMAKDQIDALILSDPSTLAWLLNIRGSDVPFTPLPLGRGILFQSGSVEVFMEPEKVTDEVRLGFAGSVTFHPPGQLSHKLAQLSGQRVWIDSAQAPQALISWLDQAGAKVVRTTDPCIALRAEKNPTELAGTRAAHLRDGAALVRFLAWLDHAITHTTVDELLVAEVTQRLRSEGDHFRDLSFPTIAGFGSNGAIVHYRSTPATNKTLEQGGILLLDSGAQYLDGTTDITRTIVVGTTPNDQEVKRRFTQVLKGHIALAQAIFPVGTTGSQLDGLARFALWADGVDYDHGTGHGVGSYLSVHEGPQRISKAGNTVALKPGMIVSDEPGYYKTGHYGIRIENLLAVIEIPSPPGAERPLLGFEVLSLVPIDRRLIDPTLLTASEAAWLDAYHARVRRQISPLIPSDILPWLGAATRPIFTS